VNTVLHLRGKTIEKERLTAEININKTEEDKSSSAGES